MAANPSDVSLGYCSGLKAKGNAAFKAGEIEKAIALYSEVSRVCTLSTHTPHFCCLLNHHHNHNNTHTLGPHAQCVDATQALSAPESEEDRGFARDLLVTCYQNLAAAHLKMDAPKEALRCTERCLEASGKNVKALFRKGRALAMLGQHAEALVALKTAARLDPKSAAVRSEYSRVKKIFDAAEAQRRKVEAAHADSVRAERRLSIVGRALKPLHSEFEVVAPIGEGNFCIVHQVVHEATGEQFALKVMSLDKVKRMRYRHKNIDNEIAIERKLMGEFDHPNICKLHQSFKDCNSLYIVMDFVPNGELWDRLAMPLRGSTIAPPPVPMSKDKGAEVKSSNGKKLVGLVPSQARHILAQLIVVLGYLRERGIVHRDLKPENMLVTPSGTLKLIDFGTAKDLKDITLNGANEFVGTAEYMTPEAMLNRAADLRSDLWALGSIVYQLHTGRPPFRSASGYLTMQRAMYGDLIIPAGFPPRAADLTRKLLRLSMAARIGAEDGPDLASIRAHPYFTEAPATEDFHKQAPLHVTTLGSSSSDDWEGLHARGNVVPSLAELCRRSATEDIAECLMTRAQRRQLSTGLSVATRAWLMHLLDRQERLSPEVHAQFFPSPLDARLSRVRFCGVLGMSRLAEGEWASSFGIAHAALPSSADAMASVAARINAAAPRFVVLSGAADAARDAGVAWRAAIATIDPSILIVRLPTEGERCSWWCGGVLCVAVDSAALGAAGPAVWEGKVGPEATPEHAEETSAEDANAAAEAAGEEPPTRDDSDEAKEARRAAKKAMKAAAAPYTGWDRGELPTERFAAKAMRDRLWLEHQLFVGKLCSKHTLVFARHSAEEWLNPVILGRFAQKTNVACVLSVGGGAVAESSGSGGVPTLVEVPLDGSAIASVAVKKSRVVASLIAVE